MVKKQNKKLDKNSEKQRKTKPVVKSNKKSPNKR